MKKLLFLMAAALFVLTSCETKNYGDVIGGFVWEQTDWHTITFTNLSKNADRYLWDFGDGQTSTNKDPVHKYKTGGIYYVTLKAMNESDNQTAYANVTVE